MHAQFHAQESEEGRKDSMKSIRGVEDFTDQDCYIGRTQDERESIN